MPSLWLCRPVLRHIVINIAIYADYNLSLLNTVCAAVAYAGFCPQDGVIPVPTARFLSGPANKIHFSSLCATFQ